MKYNYLHSGAPNAADFLADGAEWPPPRLAVLGGPGPAARPAAFFLSGLGAAGELALPLEEPSPLRPCLVVRRGDGFDSGFEAAVLGEDGKMKDVWL